jgi:hypothetical protein
MREKTAPRIKDEELNREENPGMDGLPGTEATPIRKGR